jgi:hypothetical protein
MVSALLLTAFLPAAHATTLASLNDWCFNIDGVNPATNLCNQGQTTVTVPGGVNGSAFDFTLGSQTEGTPSTPYAGYPTTVNNQNTLGSVTITLSPGASQYVLAYMDYDLNYDNAGSFQDSASTHGALAGGESYSLNSPENCTAGCGGNGSDIVNEVFTHALNDTNSVGTFAGDGVCCDVSWALGLNLNVAANTQDVVTFSVSKTAPASGFYLQQTNGIDNTQNIYFSASVVVNNTGGGSTPEPASLVLFGGGLVGVFLLRKRITVAQNNLA